MSATGDEFFSGYLIDLEDRDQIRETASPFRDAVDGLFSAPEEIDPRPWHRIENQSSMGSCQGHALTSVCEYAYHIATGKVIQFSPMWAYLKSQEKDGLIGSDRGSTISGGLKCAKEDGMCPLEVFPYPNPARYHTNIPSGAAQAAEPYKIRSHAMIESYDDVFSYLSSGLGGINIGIAWGSGMTPRNGVIETYRPGGGGHAVALLGYSTRKDASGRNYIWLANSWDTRWGNSGYAEVSPAAIEQMLNHRYTVMIGMSDLSTPHPRPVDFVKENPYG